MTVRAPRRILTAAASALLAAAGLTACADGTGGASGPGRVDVVAAFYPLQFLAERIGGDTVAVSNLTKPGAEPHDLELNPRQVGQVVDADVVVYLSGFQPAVDEAVEQNGGDRAFDVAGVTPLRDAAAGGHDHDHEGEAGHAEESGGKDPHVWLDPTRLATIGDKLAERLGKADPDHAADYTARAGALRTELTTLDTEYADGLRTCQRREIVTSHTAFGYLTSATSWNRSASAGSPRNPSRPRSASPRSPRRPGSTRPARSSSRPWSARRSPRRSRVRSGRRRPSWTRWRARPPTATTSPRCAPTCRPCEPLWTVHDLTRDRDRARHRRLRRPPGAA